MMKTYVLYNNKSNNGKGGGTARKVGDIWKDKDLVFVDVFSIDDYKEFFSKLQPDDEICICGGDGTLNHFVNDANDAGFDNSKKVYFYPTGTGNDFFNDLGKTAEDGPVEINKYIVNLPTVKVNGMKRLFVNGIGYGIDGYCCEEGDRQRSSDITKEINYTSIAIQGLLFHYKPTNAEITVDGVTHKYEDERQVLRRRNDGDSRSGQTEPRAHRHNNGDVRQGQARNAHSLPDNLQGRAR